MARLHDQQADHELLDPRLDVAPGAQHAQRHDQRGQQHQQQADAVDAQGVVDVQPRNPRGMLDELEVGRGRVELPVERQRERRRRPR